MALTQVSFEPDNSIKLAQIHRHVTTWLFDKRGASVEIVRRDAISGNVDAWLNRLHIGVDMANAAQMVDRLRRGRSKAHSEMGNSFEHWGAQRGKKFSEWYREEVNGFPQAVCRKYQESHARLRAIVDQSAPFEYEDLLPSVASRIIHVIMNACSKKHLTEDRAANAVMDYIQGADFSLVPHVHISSLLFAGIARRAAGGQKRKPGRGMLTDIDMVSTLLPYCDAMFVDKELHSFFREKEISERLGFKTKVFSMGNIGDFFDYLEQIRVLAPEPVLQAVNEVYGASWSKPFLEMYTTH